MVGPAPAQLANKIGGIMDAEGVRPHPPHTYLFGPVYWLASRYSHLFLFILSHGQINIHKVFVKDKKSGGGLEISIYPLMYTKLLSSISLLNKENTLET